MNLAAVRGPALVDVTAVSAAESAVASGPASAPPPEAARRPYPPPADLPTQTGPKGLRFDFNYGCRVTLPEGPHPWRVRLSDLDTGNVLYETEIAAGMVS